MEDFDKRWGSLDEEDLRELEKLAVRTCEGDS